MVNRNPTGNTMTNPNALAHHNRPVTLSPDGLPATDRQPKGDHNRRLALGMDVETFAREAGVTPQQLRDYEQTWPDQAFDTEVAALVGSALARLEADAPPTQIVVNGPGD
jgi:cytochrome oxidase assembly protein ShyY1